MYFLQKDDIMLHFTLSGSSDIEIYRQQEFLLTNMGSKYATITELKLTRNQTEVRLR